MIEDLTGYLVFALRGEYQGESGEVTGYRNIDFQTQKGCLVKLDKTQIPQVRYLRPSSLRLILAFTSRSWH